jgi:hypothetical protein
MAVYRVPEEFDTLQEAVEAATESDHVTNAIEIGESPLLTSSLIFLPRDFGADRRLVIRPGRGLPRALIANSDPVGQPILAAEGAGHVTLQDLDILRNITNRSDLVTLSGCYSMIIERCRIGAIFPGTSGWSNLSMSRPTDNIVRNCIFFACQHDILDHAIRIEMATALGNSLLLYNNVGADYRLNGIYVTGDGDAFLLMRNNVAVNHSSDAPDQYAYHSVVGDLMTVVTSHNVAFASVGQVEQVDGDQSISGEGDVDFLRFACGQVDRAFVQHTWLVNPLENPNVDFYRLVPGGPLHNDPGDAGADVHDGDPHPRDLAVTDDIEKDVRPAGLPLHTDRGADQIRKGDTFLELPPDLEPGPDVRGPDWPIP